MVVAICVITILYMVAEQRLNELPAAAERANFNGVLEQLKTAVNFAMVTRLAKGDALEAIALEGANPMSFLLEEPSNYEGELNVVTDGVKKRNAWYFETSSRELVYVIGGGSIEDVWITVGGFPVNLGQIRFKVVNLYTDDFEKNNWEGLVLRETREYVWDGRSEQPIELN